MAESTNDNKPRRSKRVAETMSQSSHSSKKGNSEITSTPTVSSKPMKRPSKDNSSKNKSPLSENSSLPIESVKLRLHNAHVTSTKGTKRKRKPQDKATASPTRAHQTSNVEGLERDMTELSSYQYLTPKKRTSAEDSDEEQPVSKKSKGSGRYKFVDTPRTSDPSSSVASTSTSPIACCLVSASISLDELSLSTRQNESALNTSPSSSNAACDSSTSSSNAACDSSPSSSNAACDSSTSSSNAACDSSTSSSNAACDSSPSSSDAACDSSPSSSDAACDSSTSSSNAACDSSTSSSDAACDSSTSSSDAACDSSTSSSDAASDASVFASSLVPSQSVTTSTSVDKTEKNAACDSSTSSSDAASDASVFASSLVPSQTVTTSTPVTEKKNNALTNVVSKLMPLKETVIPSLFDVSETAITIFMSPYFAKNLVDEYDDILESAQTWMNDREAKTEPIIGFTIKNLFKERFMALCKSKIQPGIQDAYVFFKLIPCPTNPKTPVWYRSSPAKMHYIEGSIVKDVSQLVLEVNVLSNKVINLTNEEVFEVLQTVVQTRSKKDEELKVPLNSRHKRIPVNVFVRHIDNHPAKALPYIIENFYNIGNAYKVIVMSDVFSVVTGDISTPIQKSIESLCNAVLSLDLDCMSPKLPTAISYIKEVLAALEVAVVTVHRRVRLDTYKNLEQKKKQLELEHAHLVSLQTVYYEKFNSVVAFLESLRETIANGEVPEVCDVTRYINGLSDFLKTNVVINEVDIADEVVDASSGEDE